MAYAENTEVPVERSKAEIEKTLQRYGASSFLYGWDRSTAVMGFTMEGRQIRIFLPLPAKDAHRLTEKGQVRTEAAIEAAYNKEIARRWRALALVIKAKLEAVETGISTFEQEFLARIVLPNGQTVGDYMEPQIAHVYETGKMPALLPSLSEMPKMLTGGKT